MKEEDTAVKPERWAIGGMIDFNERSKQLTILIKKVSVDAAIEMVRNIFGWKPRIVIGGMKKEVEMVPKSRKKEAEPFKKQLKQGVIKLVRMIQLQTQKLKDQGLQDFQGFPL